MKAQPEAGAIATAETHVGDRELASKLGLGDDPFPDVYATSRMVALMEVAASRILRPLLGDDELSVGVSVDIVHTAATAPGARVMATARYTGQDGKLFVFDVRAEDEGGEIGRGTHKRAVIANARLLVGAQKRKTPG